MASSARRTATLTSSTGKGGAAAKAGHNLVIEVAALAGRR